VKRREFITLLGGAAAWPLAVRAEGSHQMRRIGALMAGSAPDPLMQSFVSAFTRELSNLGWIEGQNVHVEYRWADSDSNRIHMLAKDLVDMQPNAILSHTTPVAAALKKQTSGIPIVFVNVADPIGSGLVSSFAHPGGNITGFSNFEFSMIGKWLDILREIVPRLSRVAVMFNPETAPGKGSYYMAPLEGAARGLAIETIAARVRNSVEIERAVGEAGRESGAGLIVMPDAFTTQYRQQIIEAADRNRVPAVYAFRYFPTAGGLISYGPNSPDLFRRAATYVDRILRGDKPAILPVQAPTKFDMVLNLKTAKAIGLTVPPTLLALADEVIE
jgi:putative tryptophan/tyrosine transport system substrate-binding protein